MQYEYLARPKSGLTDKEAAALGAVMREMQDEGVELTPRSVLERATPADSPIHDLFEWDDAKAAHRYRIDQARHKMASIEVVDRDTGKRGRGFFSLEVEKSERPARVHRSRDLVKSHGDEYARVQADLYARLSSVAREAEALGLNRTSPTWSRIVEAIHANRPLGIEDAA